MNLDDIMNENIEDVVSVSVVERAKLPNQERKTGDETIRNERPSRKATPAASSEEAVGVKRRKAEAVPAESEEETVRLKRRRAEEVSSAVAEETVRPKRKRTEESAESGMDDALKQTKTRRSTESEPARTPERIAKPEPVKSTEKAARKQTIEEDAAPAYGFPAYDDDDDDDDDEVVYGAFGDDADVEPALHEDDGEEDQEFPEDDDEEPKGFLRTLISDYLFLPIAFVVAMLIFYVFPPYIVDGPSMQKTLDDKAFGFGFRYANPERGDIVIVNTGEDGGTGGASFIKRVIGVPGDTIFCTYEKYEYDVTLSDGKIVKAGDPVYRVYLNGELLYEPYVWFGDKNIARETEKPVTLGEDEYFIMGDNRYNSNDSRAFGPIKRSDIKCTMMFFLFGKHNPE